MSKKVILSSPLLLEDGRYERLTVTKQEAVEFAKDATNYCGHETVRVIGLDPAESRKSCEWYDEALVLQPKERLEWGREYSVKEIEEIGVDFVLISRLPKIRLGGIS